MVVIRKNWQALPTTVTAPNIEDSTQPAPDPIQRPTAHLSSEPDIVELHKINHDEPNEPVADTNIYVTPHHQSGLRRGCRPLNKKASYTSSLSALHQ